MVESIFGYLPDNKPIPCYEFGSDSLQVAIITYGASIVKLVSCGRDVAGGFDTIDDYISSDSYQGATIGRFANRIRNAEFTLNGTTHHLEQNCDGNHHLHGGPLGLSKKLWNPTVINQQAIKLSLISPDGEGNYPGDFRVEVVYSVEGNDLIIDYFASCSKDTPANLTNHCYFNLDGLGGSILDHKVKINSDFISEVDEYLVPTGKKLPVCGTPFDFNDFHKIGDRLGGALLGYDHNFFLREEACKRSPQHLRVAAIAENRDRRMTVFTDRPCVQFYTGNFLGNNVEKVKKVAKNDSKDTTENNSTIVYKDSEKEDPSHYKNLSAFEDALTTQGAVQYFKNNIPQIKHGAFCLETQLAPYSIVSGEGILKASAHLITRTVYRVEKL